MSLSLVVVVKVVGRSFPLRREGHLVAETALFRGDWWLVAVMVHQGTMDRSPTVMPKVPGVHAAMRHSVPEC